MPNLFIYDSGCGFCSGFKDWLMGRAPAGMFDAVDLDDPRALAALGGMDDATRRATSHVVTPQGDVLSGHHSIQILISVTWWGRLLTPIITIPVLDPVLRLIYSTLSTYRHRLAGRR